ncbi:MAG: DEAD/DEAH box helicase [Pseudomonadota bacterium]
MDHHLTSPLSLFHPIISRWFCESFSGATDIQERSWPAIARGENLLITAPTGSGKTLTAFLWSINRLATGGLSPGRTRVLYVSPLKALNNDIQQNLIRPLGEIRARFLLSGMDFPHIRVMTRSGDTPHEERRKMVRQPPEILITTPESLNLLLSSGSGRGMLTSRATVIMDEIHAVADSKRGVHMITAVDRLVLLSGEFQRISLSATIGNPEAVADFVGGFRLEGDPAFPRYVPRPVSIIRSTTRKEHRLRVKLAAPREASLPQAQVWEPLARDILDLVRKNRSTLVFTNNRRLCEKLTFLINTLAGEVLAWSHHGSLSREIRREVESRLKTGSLKAIVATSSLELGIDIGELDEVVMVQSPPSISSAIQRVGRAGHAVARVSSGTLFAVHAGDLIPAAVLARSLDEQAVEPLEPVRAPLDVLAQVLVSMTGVQIWNMDDLFGFLGTTYPFHGLGRQMFDRVLDMLAGRYGDGRVRELSPKVSIDRLNNTVQGKKGALLSLYMSGGTIPDRGYYHLRHQETGAAIGELDEEYVWEAKIGQIATVGSQNWAIRRITHNDVFVLPAGSPSMSAPFWKAEEMRRDFHFSRRIGTFLEAADKNLDSPDFMADLIRDYHMDPPAAQALITFLKQQQEATGGNLPHCRHLVLERVRSGPDGGPGSMAVLHTLWGGRVNRPFAMALSAAWTDTLGETPEIFAGNDALVIQLSHGIDPGVLFSMVTPDNVEDLLRKSLEESGFFGARFRECAGRALLITRTRINQRMPLWMNRLRSQKLLENVLRHSDFPILLETWRTCLQDEFDMPGLKQVLRELQSKEITWSAVDMPFPGPFSRTLAWNQINRYMYQEDQPASRPSSLDRDLVREAIFTPDLRPTVSRSTITGFETKCQRLVPGYAPQSPMDLADWVYERIAIPLSEWRELVQVIQAEQSGFEPFPDSLTQRLFLMEPHAAREPLVISLERMAGIRQGWYRHDPGILIHTLFQEPIREGAVSTLCSGEAEDPDSLDALALTLMEQWLQFYGPKQTAFIETTLGLDADFLDDLLTGLEDSRAVIKGALVTGEGNNYICDSHNYEILLRMARSRAIPGFTALESRYLPLFLALRQGLVHGGGGEEGLFPKLEQLTCLPLPAAAWESDVLPARTRGYQTSWMDTLMQEGGLVWVGQEKEKILFCFEGDLDLVHHAGENPEDTPGPGKITDTIPWLETQFGTPGIRHDFSALIRMTATGSESLMRQVWKAVWQGKLTNDTVAVLRKGIENKFSVSGINGKQSGPSSLGKRRSGSRGSLAAWRASRPFSGRWFVPQIPPPPRDAMEQEELRRDRVRLLLDRYGILFRELVARELPGFRWYDLFRSLRLMELSGEVLGGHFFQGIQGLQFISRSGLNMLASPLPETAIFWMNAMDPASLCGVGVQGISLPRRIATTHLVFRGPDLVLVSARNGKVLSFSIDPGDVCLPGCLDVLEHLISRRFMP